jgi:superfamily II DNA or RNA helicase
MGDVVYLRPEVNRPRLHPDTIGNYYAGMLVRETGILPPGTDERMPSEELMQTALALLLTRDYFQDHTGRVHNEPGQTNLVASLVQAGSVEAVQAEYPDVPASRFILEFGLTIEDIHTLREKLGRATLQAAMHERIRVIRGVWADPESRQHKLRLVSENAAASDELAETSAVLADGEMHGDESTATVRQDAMVRNYDGFLSVVKAEIPGDVRGQRQKPTFEKIGDVFREEPMDGSPRGGLVNTAMSSGKGVVAARVVVGVGIGTNPIEGGRPLSALWLGQKLADLDEARKKLEQFAPGLEIGEYRPSTPTDAPVKLMTYRALLSLSDEALAELCASVDLVIGNEIHRALGPQVSERMRRLMEGKLALGFTATDRFTDPKDQGKAARSVKNILGLKTIDYMSVRDSLDTGIANGAQIFALASGRTLHINSKRDTFTEKDLAPLLDDKERNRFILDVVRMLVGEGRTGIVSCVRGGDDEFPTVAHARRLARTINGTKIIDPKTQAVRTIRAAAIGGFMNRKARQALWEQFDNGEVDVLFFSDYLKENVDSDKVEFIFDVMPRTSMVDMTQEFGRGGRWKDKLTICLQLIDNIIASRNRGKLYTFFHVVGEPDSAPITQGMVVGRVVGKRRGSGKPGSGDGRLSTNSFPEHLLDALREYEGTVLSEITVGTRQPPPPGWMPTTRQILDEFGVAATSTFINGIKKFPCEDDELPYFQVGSGKGVSYYINPEVLAWARASGVFEQAEGDIVLLADIKRKWKISDDKLKSTLGVLVIDASWRRFPDRQNMRLPFITAAENARIEEYLESEFVTFDPLKDVSIADMAAALGRHRTAVNVFVTRHNRGKSPEQQRIFYRRRIPGSRQSFCLNPVQARSVLDELGRQMPQLAVLIDDLPERIGLPPGQTDAARRLLKTSPFRWRLVTKAVHNPDDRIAWLGYDDVQEFTDWVGGSRVAKSTIGVFDDLVGLDDAEFNELDRVLFDLRRPYSLSPSLANRVAAVLNTDGIRRLDATERTTLTTLFHQPASTIDVAAGLIRQNRIQAAAKPLVTHLPGYYAQQLDGFLLGALRKMGIGRGNE